jgi:ribonuclease HII
MVRVAGVDEAGRGPVIGPMVVCGVVFQKEELEELLELGVKDSKALTPLKRENLSKDILNLSKGHEYFIIEPRTIDIVVSRNKVYRKLNYLTSIAMARIIGKLRPDTVYVDACDIRPQRCASDIKRVLSYEPRLVCEHKADSNYGVVSAASILAKVKRDQIVKELNDQYGFFNSGYASDRETIKFLKRYLTLQREVPTFVRGSWNTVKRMMKELYLE